MTDQELIRRALLAREQAYTPYSHFQVGAALLTRTGTVYPGCNIENAAYTPTNCAERTAFFSAVAQGERDFAAIAIVGGPQGGVLDYTAPCGVCRQVMMEFCDPNTFRILAARSPEDYRVFTLRELMPQSFGPADLAKKS
ncbi:MAG: cytidine deaminase [Clostridia bacterium]|nr:cytidine deaminase [Clostridia bacterium]MDD7672056.1 cytidine deaminase [Clostridia bacterium]MDY2929378.1 cytidine deaminase [Clostridiaceae bacterium]